MTRATEEDYNFSNTINLTYIEGPYDIHVVQTNKEEVNVYDHGKYLYSTKIPKVDVKYVDNARELKKSREIKIIQDAQKNITWHHEDDQTMSCETEYQWISIHSKRKTKILSLLEKYMKVRNVSKIDLVNEKFDYEINKLRDELTNINKLLDVIQAPDGGDFPLHLIYFKIN